MNRQINVTKRQGKIRGIKRRLQALDRWADSFKDCFPIEHADQKYWNYKIPVFDILVRPPRTTRKIQAHCAQALIKAASNLLEARPLKLSSAKVTVLITYPDMFGSEVCIFFDLDYFDSFFYRQSEYETLTQLDNKLSLATQLNLKLPPEFT
ncbi:MAG: DUF3916 domain-containing protein [Cyanobacteria bacterium J06600_6]